MAPHTRTLTAKGTGKKGKMEPNGRQNEQMQTQSRGDKKRNDIVIGNRCCA